jgi:hypothetical protein
MLVTHRLLYATRKNFDLPVVNRKCKWTALSVVEDLERVGMCVCVLLVPTARHWEDMTVLHSA